MEFRANMSSLKEVASDYYQNRISFSEYREQRNNILEKIDEELNGIKISNTDNDFTEQNDSSVISKALSFLKLNKFKETN